MNLFAVFRHGVYRHECMGIYSVAGVARDRARTCAAADRDSYHQYQVWPYVLNEPCEDEDLNLVNSRMVFECRQKPPQHRRYLDPPSMEHVEPRNGT